MKSTIIKVQYQHKSLDFYLISFLHIFIHNHVGEKVMSTNDQYMLLRLYDGIRWAIHGCHGGLRPDQSCFCKFQCFSILNFQLQICLLYIRSSFNSCHIYNQTQRVTGKVDIQETQLPVASISRAVLSSNDSFNIVLTRLLAYTFPCRSNFSAVDLISVYSCRSSITSIVDNVTTIIISY